MAAKSDRPITPKQQRFVQEYLVDLNATQAAIRSGYKQPHSQGPRLLENVGVKAAIAAGQTKLAERTGITVDYVLNGLREIAERCRGEDFQPAPGARALELLGKHLGMFVERRETDVTVHRGGATRDTLERKVEAIAGRLKGNGMAGNGHAEQEGTRH